ncbi:S-adenosyl-L-methionine-dependent methyltransferase [Periconia macrospinosa]|uniref:S-adenosyl-L-methionine-dependent methyltransferase n=1 Tax=Periconia macrospinosa TaxID=97972 RepID=A0A2V1E0A9_9PLEO|nr:S-adenosyl-L-methionine-dependent methyltransferase [Periconia macrospinosa]
MATKNKVESWYDARAVMEEHRLDEGRLEFEVTLRVIKSCIEEKGVQEAKILDVGGGPGRYAIELTRLGHNITLSDISSQSLTIASQNASKQGVHFDAIIHANALDLSRHPSLTNASSTFDIVLCLGPLYHTLSISNRTRIIETCIAFTKPGGYILMAYVSIYAHLRDMARRDPARLSNEWDFYSAYLNNGNYTRNANTESYHLYPEQLEKEVKGLEGVRLERIVSCEGFLGFEGARGFTQLSEEEMGRWVDVVMEAAERREVLGAADHMLVVLRKT